MVKNSYSSKQIKNLIDKAIEEKLIKLNSEIEMLKNKIKDMETHKKTKSKKIKFNVTNAKLKYIDLFCGIGGFHQALSNLGAKCVLACDIDKPCRDVYNMNYGITPVEDVKKIDETKMSDFDIICGGFPCQAFSNAGKKKTFSDSRGLLFDEIVRIAKHKKPKFMFLENVKHILKVGNKTVIEYIKKKIDDIGYVLQLFEMSPHNYGIPQQRERVYFICVRKDIYKSPVELIREKTETIKFEEYLDKKETIDDKYFIKGDLLDCLNAWDEMIKVFEVGEKISPTFMINEAIKYKEVDIERLEELNEYSKNLKKSDETEKESLIQEIEDNNYSECEKEFIYYADWRRDYIMKNKPLYVKYKDNWDEWYEKHKELISKREIYAKLEWQVGKIKENDSIFNYFIQMRQSGIRVKKAKYFPTLVAISQIPIYGKEKRYLTPKEGLRLQSFPDSFKLLEEDKHSYKQLGNSVNVSNVSNVIESTLKLYGYA